MVNQPGQVTALPGSGPDAHLERIQGKVGSKTRRELPTHDTAREHVGDKRGIDPAGERADVGVGSASSALSGLRRVGFCWPPSEPDVPIPEHPALHAITP